MQHQMAFHSVPYQTKLLDAIDFERNQMTFSLLHRSTQYFPLGSQFKALDVSLDWTIVPLPDKINFHQQVGEMLYSEINRNAMTISKAKKLLEKSTVRLNQERANYRALHMQNKSFKQLIMKESVNPEDKIAFKSLLQSSQTKIQELRHKIKMSGSDRVQSKELSQVEKQKEILAKELIERNNEIVSL